MPKNIFGQFLFLNLRVLWRKTPAQITDPLEKTSEDRISLFSAPERTNFLEECKSDSLFRTCFISVSSSNMSIVWGSSHIWNSCIFFTIPSYLPLVCFHQNFISSQGAHPLTAVAGRVYGCYQWGSCRKHRTCTQTGSHLEYNWKFVLRQKEQAGSQSKTEI